jgi:hypothetical protein
MMVVFLAEKEAMVFVVAQVIAHDPGQQINHLVDFLFAHAGNKFMGKTVAAEQAEKGDQGLFVCGAVDSEKHGDS